VQLQWERATRTCERNNSADTKVNEEGRGGHVPGSGAEIPLQPVEKNMVSQACVPVAHGGSRLSRSPPAAWGGPHAEAGG